MDLTDLITAVKTLEGRRQKRLISEEDIALIHSKLASAPENVTGINLYGIVNGGWVPNSYKYPAPMTTVRWRRAEEGWSVEVSTTQGKRSNGAGPEVTLETSNQWRATSLADIRQWCGTSK